MHRTERWCVAVLAVALVAVAGLAPAGAASTMPTAPQPNVGTVGGVLGTPDGAFAMTVPPSVLRPGYNLGVLESATPPSQAPALPAGVQVVSRYFALSGYDMSAPQSATIGYNAAWAGDAPAAALSVYAWRGGTAWQFQPAAVNATKDTVRIYISGPETVAVFVSRTTFADVPAGYWAANPIDAMVAAGVMNGLGGGVFGPDQPVTRAQFAKMLALGLNLPPAAGPPSFSDVPAAEWYSGYVATVAQAGLMTGETATTFDPNAPVTREELAVLLMRALKLQPSGGLGFSDSAQVDSWAVGGVEAAVTSGYMMGYPDGTFQPLAPLTRAQAAAVLARVIASEAP